MKNNKIYTVKITSSGNPYDEKQLFRSIYDSLSSIKNISFTESPVSFISDNYIKMILFGRVVKPIFGQLYYNLKQSTYGNHIFSPLHHAQMLRWKERIVIA